MTRLVDFGPFASQTADAYNTLYGLILTCLTTRAVRLKMCHDLFADATLSALRRFFASPGTPSTFCFGIETIFSAAERELSKPSTPHLFLSMFWKNAPHLQGVWERLVRSLKNDMYAIIASKNLTDNTFNTVLCVIE